MFLEELYCLPPPYIYLLYSTRTECTVRSYIDSLPSASMMDDAQVKKRDEAAPAAPVPTTVLYYRFSVLGMRTTTFLMEYDMPCSLSSEAVIP